MVLTPLFCHNASATGAGAPHAASIAFTPRCKLAGGLSSLVLTALLCLAPVRGWASGPDAPASRAPAATAPAAVPPAPATPANVPADAPADAPDSTQPGAAPAAAKPAVTPPRYSASDAKLAFGFLDANKDGQISREEAARAKNILKYFDRADTNQDKGLSLEEFTAALNKAKVI